MYSNYNVAKYPNNMYNKSMYQNNDERFGLIGPLLLGGLAGYAIGNNNYNVPCCPPPVYYKPIPYQQPYQSYNFYYR